MQLRMVIELLPSLSLFRGGVEVLKRSLNFSLGMINSTLKLA